MSVRVTSALHDIAYIEFGESSNRDGLLKSNGLLTGKGQDRMTNGYKGKGNKILPESVTTTSGSSTYPDTSSNSSQRSQDGSEMMGEAAVENLLRFVPAQPTVGGWQRVTTVVVKNLLPEISQKEFLDHLMAIGFDGSYDCVYVPFDTQSKQNKGYALINFLNSGFAWKYKHRVDGIATLPLQADLGGRLKVAPAAVQGVEAIHAHHAAAMSTMVREEPHTEFMAFHGPTCEAVPPTRLGFGSSLSKQQKWSTRGRRHNIAKVNVKQQSVFRYCYECGAQTLPPFKFCAHCGCSLADLDVSESSLPRTHCV
jgi:hypothetical protein